MDILPVGFEVFISEKRYICLFDHSTWSNEKDTAPLTEQILEATIAAMTDGTRLKLPIIDFDPFKPRKEHLLFDDVPGLFDFVPGDVPVANCRCIAFPSKPIIIQDVGAA